MMKSAFIKLNRRNPLNNECETAYINAGMISGIYRNGDGAVVHVSGSSVLVTETQEEVLGMIKVALDETVVVE